MHGVGFTPHPDPGVGQVHCAVITVSDTRAHPVADGIYPEDPGGELLQSQLGQAGHLVVDYRRVPDEQRQIREAVNAIADLPSVQVILLTGGTGIAPRDVTCESIAGLLEKELPGFGELFRMLSYEQVGSRAMASRAIAGVYRQRLIFALPGSLKAIALALEKLILPELIHLTQLLQAPT
jgi:molybdopterin adenylyltransferase